MSPRCWFVLVIVFAALLVGGVDLAWAQEPAAEAASEAAAPPEWVQRLNESFASIDAWFGRWIVAPLATVLFFDLLAPLGWLGLPRPAATLPIVVAWLFCGAVFFTLRMGFINFRGFKHAISLTMGHYDDPSKPGEVTHFQALASALSATVGLGNIAGVAIAVGTGGPGAVFWLIVAGLLGMTSKFTECSLGQLYRKTLPDGTVSGGPMHYLKDGLATKGLPRLGAVLATAFTILCIGGSLGGGCMFQVGQSMQAVQRQIPLLVEQPYWYGLAMVVMAGVVIIGGIKRIASVADKIVPLMAGLYIVMSLYILAAHWSHIPAAIGEILSGAFTPSAAYGGALGVMVIGIRRASFSNEAGVGSAAIAHSAAKTDEPVSEGIVALLEPFIDTVVICTMTGLIIVITEIYADPSQADLIAGNKGAELTANAVGSVVGWFPLLLALVVFLFAYSTLISWSYYGERCATHLFGPRASLPYKILFLCFVFLGSILAPTNVLDFSDLMILAMAFPNVLGMYILAGDVRRKLDDYWGRYKSGALKRRH